ncbi:MAG: tetratricopeptide repeat protein, partial [Bradyrhizobium sp.]
MVSSLRLLEGSLEREPCFAIGVAPTDTPRYGRRPILLRGGAHGFVNKTAPAQYVRRDAWRRLTGTRVPSHNEPPVARGDQTDMRRSVSPMLRAFFLVAALLVVIGPARAAGDIDTCRNNEAEPAARLAACETVIADDKITGKSRAGAFWVRGDSLMKKRDYDGAIAAFSAALDADPENVFYLNARGLAYGDKGDDQHALADYELCLKVRPNYASAFNNRGLIFMRKGDLDRAFEEFNSAIKYPASNTSRYIHLFNRARVQTYRKQYDAALVDFAEAQKLSPEGPQVANYRCITYTEVGKFDEALADCNA